VFNLYSKRCFPLSLTWWNYFSEVKNGSIQWVVFFMNNTCIHLRFMGYIYTCTGGENIQRTFWRNIIIERLIHIYLIPSLNSWWINNTEFVEIKLMMSTSLILCKKIRQLKLWRHILKSNMIVMVSDLLSRHELHGQIRNKRNIRDMKTIRRKSALSSYREGIHRWYE
jgi:hypothetical protein